MRLCCVLLPALFPLLLYAGSHTGVVISAGQPLPGVVITASKDTDRMTTTTDEEGRYRFDNLTPGSWNISAELFGFTKATRQLTQAEAATTLEISLELGAAPPPSPAVRRAIFQQLSVNRSNDSAEEEATAALPELTAEASESLLVSGSISQGLQTPMTDEFTGMPFRPGMGGPFGPGMPGAFGVGDDTAPRGGPGGPGGGPGMGGPGGPGGPGMGPGAPGMGPGGRGGPGMGGGMGRGPMAGGGRGRGDRIADRMAQRRAAGETSFGNRRRRSQPSIRGMAFAQLGNSAFDARQFSLTGQLLPKPAYAQNRFGIMLGGTLRIPKLYENSRTSFTLSYNASRDRRPYSASATLPTALERAGDFSQSQVRGPVTIFDRSTGAPFPGNRIPVSRLDPIALGLLSFIPEPNQPGSVQNYQILRSVPRDSDSLNLRVNQSLNSRNRISGGLQLQRRDALSALLYGFLDESDAGGSSFNVNWAYTLAPRKIHNLRFSSDWNRNETIPFFAYRDNVAANLGILGPSANPINWGPPNLNFTNFGDLTDGSALARRARNWSVQDSFNLIQGSRNYSFGFEVRRASLDTNTDQNARGTFTLTGLATSAFDAEGQPIPGTGYDFADFLLGLPQSSSIRYGSSDIYFRSWVYSAFAQNDWRIRPNLTVNMGVRYEYFTPFREKNGHIANLDIAPGFTGVAVVTPGQSGPYTGRFPSSLIDPDANNVAPRIGFAWRPFKERRIQLRGGYSHFYDGSAYNTLATRLAAQPPFAQTAQINTSTARTLTLRDGFGADATKAVQNTFAVDRNYRLAYAQTWNIAISQELPGAIVVEAGYLGTKGTRLDMQRLPNRAAHGSTLTAEERRMIGNAANFTFASSEGNSIFHAAQIRAVRRLRRGISANLLYTWGKSIDNATSIGGSGATIVQNDRDFRAERGLSNFDQRHALALSAVFQSPVGENGWLRDNKTIRMLFGEWTLQTTINARTGHPLTARVLGNVADTGGTGAVGSGRADATGLPVVVDDGFFNTAAFAVPAPGLFGNAGRNTVPGPGAFSLDASVGRSFSLTDRRRLEFRVQAENLTNHVNYTSVVTVVNASNFGLATAAGTMRQLSAQVRLRF